MAMNDIDDAQTILAKYSEIMFCSFLWGNDDDNHDIDMNDIDDGDEEEGDEVMMMAMMMLVIMMMMMTTCDPPTLEESKHECRQSRPAQISSL